MSHHNEPPLPPNNTVFQHIPVHSRCEQPNASLLEDAKKLCLQAVGQADGSAIGVVLVGVLGFLAVDDVLVASAAAAGVVVLAVLAGANCSLGDELPVPALRRGSAYVGDVSGTCHESVLLAQLMDGVTDGHCT